MKKLQIAAWVGRLGGRHAFDGYVWVLLLIASAWVTLIIDFGRLGTNLEAWAVAGTVASLVALGWLALCRLLWLRLDSHSRRGWFVAAAYFSVGLVRNGALTVVCLALGLAPQGERIIVSGLATLVLLALANQTAARRIASRAIEHDLLRERQKLIWLSASYDEKVTQAQKLLHQQIASDVFPALRTAVQKLDEDDSAEAADLANYLTDTVNNIVRPLSEKLAMSTEPILEKVDEISGENIELSSGIRYSISEALKPTLTVGMLLAAGLILSPALGNSGNFVGYTIACGIAWLALTGFKKCWPKKYELLNRPTAAATLSLTYILVFALSVSLATGFPSFSTLSLIQYSFGIGGAMILTRMALLEQTNREAQRMLAHQNASLARLISGLRKQIWLARRNTAWVLHGPIQSALTSAAIALSSGSTAVRDRKTIRDSIHKALAALDTNLPSQLQLRESLEDIAKVWQRSCAVTFSLDSTTESVLRGDEDSTFCVIEIVREAVSNAVRHGGARHASTRIGMSYDGLISVQVENDGTACPVPQDLGLGSAMLDQITHIWTRENLQVGVRLSALIVPERGR